ncbi:DUF6286 domain-containing protein [Actinoallomurus purpureus]|uniref:DUF6286 domain-containing protein n=1 Tax=Actinoallomurus purpureus TaxID=478114 RepID=UPI00209327E4|nr:DUF6286 domain-containing protein [Actinoallomurus purpureus]MCO6008727.1 DUF6286 domain-containing protein [Actinoallomurus purpureus]
MEGTTDDAIGAGDTVVHTVHARPMDPSDLRRVAVRFFRPRRTPAAVVTAALLTVTGAGTAAGLISTMLGHPLPRTRAVAHAERLLRTMAWNDPAVLAIAGGAGLAGLLLVLVALLPGHGGVAAMEASDPRCLLGVGRAGLCTALEAAALGVPGITEARVRLRGPLRRRAVVHAATGYRNPGTLRELVADAVRARIDATDLVRAPRVVVHLRWRED